MNLHRKGIGYHNLPLFYVIGASIAVGRCRVPGFYLRVREQSNVLGNEYHGD
jgi:hypothetical protein